MLFMQGANVMKRTYKRLLISLITIGTSCFSCAPGYKTYHKEKAGKTYLYMTEIDGEDRYKPTYVYSYQSESEYLDKDMSLNDAWFGLRADATYYRSDYYDPYYDKYDFAKITYNLNSVSAGSAYWRFGTYLSNVPNVIAFMNGDIYETNTKGEEIHSPYAKKTFDFYTVREDFYKNVMKIVTKIVSGEPYVRSSESK